MPSAALLAAILAAEPPAPVPPAPDGWALWSRHCLGCHSAGGSAPLALDARGPIARKAATIATVLRERFMPPWLPTAGGPFAHDLPTDGERDAIAAWARAGAAGAPETAAADVPGTTAWARIAAGWQVPADGAFMRTFAEDESPLDGALRRGGVRGFRMRRTSGAVERAMLGLDATGTLARLDADDPGPGAYVHADAPGAPAGSLAVLGVDSVFLLPDGWVLPAPAPDGRGRASTLAVELHAVGRGVPSAGDVALACIDAPTAAGAAMPTRTVATFRCGPDGALRTERGERTTTTTSGPLVRAADVGVIALRPDTRCTLAKVTARSPDGTDRVLLEIPRYREGLDRAYRFDPPVRLPAGTVVVLHTQHADDNALAKSQPMALLWCAPDAGGPTFPASSAQPAAPAQAAEPRDLPPDAADGITWFDAVEACNARSARDGLAPAYRVRHAERIDGHVVLAQVERVPGAAGWRLPRAADIARDPAAQGWWWTDDEDGLSAFRIAEPATGRTDSLAPNLRISGVRAGMTRPAVASPGNQGHDSASP